MESRVPDYKQVGTPDGISEYQLFRRVLPDFATPSRARLTTFCTIRVCFSRSGVSGDAERSPPIRIAVRSGVSTAPPQNAYDPARTQTPLLAGKPCERNGILMRPQRSSRRGSGEEGRATDHRCLDTGSAARTRNLQAGLVLLFIVYVTLFII